MCVKDLKSYITLCNTTFAQLLISLLYPALIPCMLPIFYLKYVLLSIHFFTEILIPFAMHTAHSTY